MARASQPHPTKRELEILHVLWAHGASSTADIVVFLSESGEPSHSAVATTLTIMDRKGYVARNDTVRPHLYVAAVTQTDVERQFIQYLTDKVFRGSTSRLVARALDPHVSSEEDLTEITRLLTEMKESS